MPASPPPFQTVRAARASTWLGSGFDLFRQAPAAWAVGALLTCLMLLICLRLPVLAFGLLPLALPALLAALMQLCASLRVQRTPDWQQIGTTLYRQWRAVLALGGVLCASLLGVRLLLWLPGLLEAGSGRHMLGLLLGGLLLLLLCVLGMALCFAPALVSLAGQPAPAALSLSLRATLANHAALARLVLIALALLILAVLPLGLGLLVLLPCLAGAGHAAYLDIFASLPIPQKTVNPSHA